MFEKLYLFKRQVDAGNEFWEALEAIANKYGLDADGDVITYGVKRSDGTYSANTLYFNIRKRVLKVEESPLYLRR